MANQAAWTKLRSPDMYLLRSITLSQVRKRDEWIWAIHRIVIQILKSKNIDMKTSKGIKRWISVLPWVMITTGFCWFVSFNIHQIIITIKDQKMRILALILPLRTQVTLSKPPLPTPQCPHLWGRWTRWSPEYLLVKIIHDLSNC